MFHRLQSFLVTSERFLRRRSEKKLEYITTLTISVLSIIIGAAVLNELRSQEMNLRLYE